MIRGSNRPWVAAIAALVAATLGVTFPLSASADVADDGLWYFDALNVAAAQDAGFTGRDVTIAVIDSPYNPDVPTLAAAKIQTQAAMCYRQDGSVLEPISGAFEDSFHGTNVLSMIVGSGAGYEGQRGVKGVAPDATILFYAAGDGDVGCYTKDGVEDPSSFARAITAAVDAGADIISLSASTDRGPEEFDAIVKALNAGVLLVMSITNQLSFEDTPGISISGFNGVVAVQAVDKAGRLPTYTDLGVQKPAIDPDTEVVAPGVDVLTQGTESSWRDQALRSGSSWSTPIVAGFLADVSQKYPDATANQILQSLVSNAGGHNGVPSFDSASGFGWGSASLTNMLAADPSQYPDVNPLLSDVGSPTPADLAAAEQAPSPEATPPAAEPGAIELSGPLLVAGIIAALIAVAAITVILVILRARASRKTTTKRDGGV